MLVKIPTIITNNDRHYKLYLEYKNEKDNIWCWRATYIDDHGVLFRSDAKSRLQDIENEVFSFIDKHRFDI